ncbi:hypothetical protein PT974_10173 [Cladobotryum mycophilum]|uniref:Polycomb protein VEFS-Box domain-containing protein n=1 Tax=Cladobotryum mycophilum TaxID=491253 RepID=A0ABR0S947_9HYPO
MGNTISSPVHKGSHQIDHDGAPPLKRRRISSPDSLDVDHLVASPKTSDSRPALRIEVLRVLHKDSKKVRSPPNSSIPRDANTKASCRITISDLSSGRPRVLHCQSQVCNLEIFKNPVGPHRIARICLPRPFYIPEESMLINRPDDGKFDLSDSYEILIELEAAHEGPWPPLDSTDFGIPSAPLNPALPYGRTWILSSRYDSIFGKLKSPLSISSGYPSQRLARQTDYVMDVDLGWTSGFKALRRLEKGSMPCINAIDPDTDPFTDDVFGPPLHGAINGTNDANGTNGADGNHVDELPLEMEEEPEGAQTPSRSLRTRENKVYNLKVLSDQAQGKERKRRARGTHAPASEGRVNYLLPSDQPVCLDYFRCVTCGACHQTMLDLQAHLLHVHPDYQYVLETTSQGPQFRVTSSPESVPSPSRNYELKPPVKPFNLQALVAGDQSWITLRHGSDDDVHKSVDIFGRSRSRSPGLVQPKPTQRRSGRTKSAKVLVPDIPNPLFDPISRARLIPGQEVPKTMPDNTWLIQKHRESIGDFSDVTPAEKEYIWEWDGYILDQGLTSAAYFPRTWLNFVQQKADWLVAAEQRMLEFGKHTSVLVARDLIDDKIVRGALSCINEARARAQVKPDESDGIKVSEIATKQSPRAAQIRKNANGCNVCQLPVLGPRMLVCSNKKTVGSVTVLPRPKPAPKNKNPTKVATRRQTRVKREVLN